MMWNGASKLRDIIQSGRMATGFGITLSEPAVAEMAGYAGFDYVFIDTEHTPMQHQQVLQHLVAARSSNCVALIRVCEIAPAALKPILDMGPDGIIFPFVHTAALARLAVAACSYPDRGGIRGQGPARAVCYGFGEEANYLSAPDRYLLRIMLIESWEGYRNLDEILAVPGVDGIYIGMGDMGRSMTAHGITMPADQVFADICRRTLAAGKMLGAPILSESMRLRAIAQQVQWGTVAIDIQLLADGMRNSLTMWGRN